MRYRSNIEAPDLAPYFRLLDPPMQHAGHDTPSDPVFDPLRVGYFTHDEAAILWAIARRVGGLWIDMGARLGWTAAHLAVAGCSVIAIDQEYAHSDEFAGRAILNLRAALGKRFDVELVGCKTAEFTKPVWCTGAVIDADHDPPNPLNDTKIALRSMGPDCAIVFHDCLTGLAVRDGIRYLMDMGFQCRMYWTPNGVACCWRGLPGFVPPDHTPDPNIDFASHRATMADFWEYLKRCA